MLGMMSSQVPHLQKLPHTGNRRRIQLAYMKNCRMTGTHVLIYHKVALLATATAAVGVALLALFASHRVIFIWCLK